MDTSRIRKLACGAREALRAEVASRLDAVLAEGSRERLESAAKVGELERAVELHGREAVVDSAAYTWFNRLCALRFMDVRGVTPVGVVSPRPEATLPAILADARARSFAPEWGLDRLARDRVLALLEGTVASANPSEEAYGILLEAAIERYAEPMGYLFGAEVASSLLMPRGLLAQGSILQEIVAGLDDEACGSVEVLGWLYQFYISERKDEVFAGYKKKKKAQAADIAPATQLFTPNWIVRYLAENSLGRLWMLNDPDSELAERMDYYIAPDAGLAGAEAEEARRAAMESALEVDDASEIRVLDPACGSGHILVYAFDLLFAMYEEEGYLPESIPQMILENNLVGFEIDERAAEIAMFALEMKALEKDPGFLAKNVDARIRVLEPVRLTAEEKQAVPELAERVELMVAFEHLDEVGSLFVPAEGDADAIRAALESLATGDDLFMHQGAGLREKLEAMLATVELLSQRFHCVIANPPYMGSGNMNLWLSGWVKKHYPDEKNDLCTCFINRGLQFAKQNGLFGEVTMESWMFISSFAKLRERLLGDFAIETLAQVFDARKHADSFSANAMMVVRNGRAVESESGVFFRLSQMGDEAKAVALRQAIENPECGWFYRAKAKDFKAIPGMPIAYWASSSALDNFRIGDSFGVSANAKAGITTGDNATFIRFWWELSNGEIVLDAFELPTGRDAGCWFPCNKGGDFRKWYGNRENVMAFGVEARERMESLPGYRPVNLNVQLKRAVSWSDITSGENSFRDNGAGALFDHVAISAFPAEESFDYSLAFLNSSVAGYYLRFLAPTLHCNAGEIAKLPFVVDRVGGFDVALVHDSVQAAHDDWDSFETSWDFARHPLLPAEGTQEPSRVADAYARWEAEAEARFASLKANEEELNRIFARIYSMEGEVSIEVPEDKVSVRRADRQREAKSLISYGVGCMLGRYSHEQPGLILANAGEGLEDFRAKAPEARFLPDEDNVLPVLDSEWFEDEILLRFYGWLEAVFGKETVGENVAWLEESLGMGLRKYFVKQFYKDHLQTYRKRPIYWIFSSPKGTFQALVYMHRYDESTVGVVLTRYLRPFKDKLRDRLEVLSRPDASAREQKEASKLQAQLAELDSWEREVLYPLAHERVSIDLDDGVKVNYNKFPHALAKAPGLSNWK